MNNVRVRFAPSPTGYLHVGGLRTALYNYLFAKKNNGIFVLRIEDTDQNRFVEGAMEKLIDTLKKCRIESDEGPAKGGQFGPYIQSQRRDIYHRHAQILLETGHAYKCFCTSERLEKMRAEQKSKGEASVYDGHCRHLEPTEILKNENSGKPYTIRLKVPETGTVSFEDIVRGKVEFELPLIDDQILIKSDGYPTYHLANVVDDHLMEISHVIRGEEWLPSTPKHVLMYQAFGWNLPAFSHLPLLLNSDRSKLSKRQGDVAVEDYLGKGYLPEALVNFVALLGWNPGTDQELFSLDEMIEDFSLEKVHKAGAVFDMDKLSWMNGQYIRQLDEPDYLNAIRPYLPEPLIARYADNVVDKILIILKEKIDTFEQLKEHLTLFMEEEISIDNSESEELVKLDSSKMVYRAFLKELEGVASISAQEFKGIMKSIQKTTGIKGKLLFMPMRIALTGQMHGPDLSMTVEIFGKEKIIQRLNKALEL